MLERVDISGTDEWVEGTFCLPKTSLIGRYLTQFIREERAPEISGVEVVRPSTLKEVPFITIVTRTQGVRLEELQETLLCISAQSDRDFEMCIVGHDINDVQKVAILGVVAMQPAWLRDRIRFIVVEGGSRSRPLNVAFSLARTDYVTILDDDDVVFDNWIEAFHKTAREYFGTIVFSYVVTQEWEVASRGSGERVLRAVGSPVPAYCKNFDVFRQVSINSCPTMGLAFPRFVFDQCGQRFDEMLTTTEDWDFLMRSSYICGVSNSEEVVAIYRLWSNATSSYSLHDAKEWERNRRFVQRRLAKYPILLPECAFDGLVKLEEKNSLSERIDADDPKLYFDRGSGFSYGDPLRPTEIKYDQETQTNTIVFSRLEKQGDVMKICLGLGEEGMMTVTDFEMLLRDTSGQTYHLGPDDLLGNGFAPEPGSMVFIRSNPAVCSGVPKGCTLSSVEVSFTLYRSVGEDLLAGTRLVVGMKEKMRRIACRFRRL